MKKLILFLTLTGLFSSVYSQKDIRANILSYTDSTEIIVRNGRKLIVDKIIEGEHEEALNALNFLKKNVDKHYVTLYPVEELLFSLATRNFPLFLYNAKNFNSLLDGKTKAPFNQSLVPDLQEYTNREMPFILDELQQFQIAEKEKQVIQFYLQYYMNEERTNLNKSIKNYLKAHPDSEYTYFLNEIKNLTTTGRMNFVFGYGNEFLNGAIAETFTNRLHVMDVELEAFINQLYLSLFMGGSVSPVYSSMDLPVKKKEGMHAKEEKVSSLKYGIKIGRILFSNPRLNLYPYLSLGGYEMNSQSSEFDDQDSSTPKNNLTGSFFAGFGAASDIVLKKWESNSIYSPAAFAFIRPQVGYDQFLSNKVHAKGYDFHFTVSVGISLGSFY